MPRKTYTGGCQCGAVRFEVTADLDQTVTCNCARCQRIGSVLTFVPRADFTLRAGEGAQTAYLFNTEKIEHLFCTTCGVQSFSYGTTSEGHPTVAVNVNCLDGVDPRALTSHHFDGARI